MSSVRVGGRRQFVLSFFPGAQMFFGSLTLYVPHDVNPCLRASHRTLRCTVRLTNVPKLGFTANTTSLLDCISNPLDNVCTYDRLDCGNQLSISRTLPRTAGYGTWYTTSGSVHFQRPMPTGLDNSVPAGKQLSL